MSLRFLPALAALAVVLALAAGPASKSQAAFPGANGRILFSSDRDGAYDIIVMNADGTGLSNLTNTPALSERDGSWSPDGSQIVFGRPNNGFIYVMNADGSGMTQLVSGAYPAWSPDGSKIVYATEQTAPADIFVMNADGTDPINLTNNPAEDRVPAWSPDGSKIAFASDRDSAFYDIIVMNADGTGQTNLTPTHSVVAINARIAWSPDSGKLIFNGGLANGEDIYVMNADGTGLSNLTNDSACYFSPDWSPNGNKIVFARAADCASGSDIYVMNNDRSGLTNLTNNPASDLDSSWQPLPASLTKGDIDCDGTITSVDALFLLRGVAHLPVNLGAGCPPIGVATVAATDASINAPTARGDMDCDGVITAVDALAILRHVALLPPPPAPEGCPPIGSG